MLIWIKLLHTAVWVVMVACIAGIYLSASVGRFHWTLVMALVVLVEVVVLVANGMRCPLTPIAGRHTADRRANFDIFLPEWLARFNKEIFGTLYAVGLGYALLCWLRSPG
ncbi:MAG: hypothetical protein FJ206_06850 [Gemmatimonadetes bacterium]|nr:hypothetical protein [Gemmatimonadota bacterium]